ncbi:putative nuclease HARBI1 [Linepithema humile]|uniref:putative nuclease HARBI1 n=1 Tax=Linepithema humile TaxID=83485 RepID=UPI00351DB2A2
MADDKFICILGQILTCAELLFYEEEHENSYNKEFKNVIMFLSKRSIKRPINRLQGYVENVIPCYNDEQFKSHFRMKRATFNYILQIIKPTLLRSRSGRKTISPEKQFFIAIWKMATPDSYRSICEKFNVARATALNAVRKVTKALVKLAPRFITWPEGHRAEEIMRGFAATSAFPRVIGAIDGTHINIKVPHVNPECYVNRKNHHSIHLQAVSDHTGQFIHCLAGHVGSVHDQRVFRLSEINNYLEDAEKFPNDSHILGDAAYTIHEHLMTPFRDNGHLTVRQKNYNFCHSSARISIERAFGLLKGRFRSLLSLLDMERVDLIPEFIILCCVLHNICFLQNDDFPIIEPDILEADNNKQLIYQRRSNNAGYIKRDLICDNLIIRNA